eukprot:COSAG06_NODE_1206_length_10270_cov_8.055255_14_plen_65_part_01
MSERLVHNALAPCLARDMMNLVRVAINAHTYMLFPRVSIAMGLATFARGKVVRVSPLGSPSASQP